MMIIEDDQMGMGMVNERIDHHGVVRTDDDHFDEVDDDDDDDDEDADEDADEDEDEDEDDTEDNERHMNQMVMMTTT
jgi:hypothetical protein